MSVLLTKWGNAVGIRIPSHILKKANLHQGDFVEFELLKTGDILIKPAHKKLTLDELLSGITKKNLHKEIDWGNDEGEEL